MPSASCLATRWRIFHFDGPAKPCPKIGTVGGPRSCHLGHWDFASHLDPTEHQTQSTVELKAAISAVVKVTQKTIIFGEPHYILDGVKGYEWRRNGWCLLPHDQCLALIYY